MSRKPDRWSNSILLKIRCRNAGGQTSEKLDEMFAGSASDKKVNLKLDENSTLFILDNTVPNADYIDLSSVDIRRINDFLGRYVSVR